MEDFSPYIVGIEQCSTCRRHKLNILLETRRVAKLYRWEKWMYNYAGRPEVFARIVLSERRTCATRLCTSPFKWTKFRTPRRFALTRPNCCSNYPHKCEENWKSEFRSLAKRNRHPKYNNNLLLYPSKGTAQSSGRQLYYVSAQFTAHLTIPFAHIPFDPHSFPYRDIPKLPSYLRTQWHVLMICIVLSTNSSKNVLWKISNSCLWCIFCVALPKLWSRTDPSGVSG